jgi:hypothetical protein
LHDTRQLTGALAWQDQPAFDRLPAKPVERDVERFLRDQAVIHFFESRVEWKCPRFLQRGLPECVKIRGLIAVRAVGL